MKYELAEIYGLEAYLQLGFSIEDESNPEGNIELGASYNYAIAENIFFKPYIDYKATTGHHVGVYKEHKYSTPKRIRYLPWKQSIKFGSEFNIDRFFIDFNYKLYYSMPIDNDKNIGSIDYKKERKSVQHLIDFKVAVRILENLNIASQLTFNLNEVSNLTDDYVALDKNRTDILGLAKNAKFDIIQFGIGLTYEVVEDLILSTFLQTYTYMSYLPSDKNGKVKNPENELSNLTVPSLVFKTEYKF